MKFITKLAFICYTITYAIFINRIYAFTEINIDDPIIRKNCLNCIKNIKPLIKYCKRCPAKEILNSIKILTPDETLDEIIFNNKSITRFGDVDFTLILGISLKNFQDSNQKLTERLLEVLHSNEDNLLIGLWNSFNEKYRELYIDTSKRFWEQWVKRYKYKLISLIDLKKVYGSTNMSRFYFDYKDRSHVGEYVKKLKMIWDKKDIVMIEGEKTRLGVGNDLFNNAKSIQRILCPNSNAFDLYDKILNEAIKLDKNKLIIIALGPTATVLAYDLYKLGYQVVDVGHIDIEYEWYLRNATSMIKINNKHVFQAINGIVDIEDVQDKNYNKQIIAKILN